MTVGADQQHSRKCIVLQYNLTTHVCTRHHISTHLLQTLSLLAQYKLIYGIWKAKFKSSKFGQNHRGDSAHVYIYLFIITPDGSQTYSYTNLTQLYSPISQAELCRRRLHRGSTLPCQIWLRSVTGYGRYKNPKVQNVDISSSSVTMSDTLTNVKAA